jgi:hypothetical protein
MIINRFVLGIVLAISAAGCATSRPMQESEKRAAAASACAGVPETELDSNPLTTGRVLAVEPLRESPYTSRGAHTLTGATVIIAASPGMTQQWLQRLFECNAARRALEGRASLEKSPCPLQLTREVPAVGALPDAFAINLRTNDTADAKLLLEECRALVGTR